MDVVVAGSANNFTFSVIDFTNPVTPTVVQVNPGFGGASTVDAKSNFAAVGDLTGSNVALFDVTNPAAPALLGSIATQLAGIAAISMDGMRVLAGEMNGLRAVLIDFTTPNSPVILSTFNTGISSISSIALSGARAVAGGPNDGQLSAIDYSNPNNPTKTLFDPGLAGGLTVDLDGTMCAAGDQNGSQVALIDISGAPSKLGTANTSLASISSVSIVGSRVAASSPNNANIAFIDFTNPNNPSVANFNPGFNGGCSLKRTANRLAAGDILGQGVKLFSLAGNTATLLGSANSGINSIGSVAFTSFPGGGPPPTKPKMQVSQNSFAFGSVAVCQSGSQTLTIKNIGNATLKITSISAPAPFSASPSGASSIAPGGSLPVTVKFTPTAVVPSNATLTIASNDPTTPSLGLPLSGTGIPTPPAKIAVALQSPSFGACLVNYFIGKRITINNLSPCLPLTVSSLSTGDAVFPITANDPTTLPSTTSLGPVTIPGGGNARFVIVFAPPSTGPFSATLTIKSNDLGDPTVTIPLSGTGVLAKATSVDLVLDTSGSMGDPAPGGTKMDALKSAVGLFVDLLPDGQGDFIGGVTFSDQAQPLIDYAAVDAAEKATVKAAVAPLTPLGSTSIGSGLNLGFDQIIFNAHTPRKVLLVFTDGMENTPPMIADVETPILQAGIEIYAVGLGSGAEIDAGKLNQLAATSNGKFFASDDTLILRKNFVQVLADAFRMNMAADPVLTIAQGQTIDVKVAVTRCESRLRFVCAWDDLDQRLDLTVIGPDGTIFTPNSPNSNRLVSYVTQPGYAFYNLAVPPLDDSDRIAPLVIGTWTMRVGTTHLQTAQERFTTSLVVDTEIEMVTHVNPAATAAASQIAVTILHAGIPVPGAEVKIVFGAPTISAQGLICKSRGALIFPPSELDHLGPRVPPGRVPPGRRSRRAASAPQARSAKALSPRSAKNAVRIPMKNTTLTARLNEEFNYAANLPRFVRDGIYQLVVQATVPACGGTVTRYGNFAFVPFQLLSGRMSVISVAAAPGVGKAVSVRITPRDDAGNLVGLGLAAKFKIEVPRNVTLIRVTDRFDGSYDLLLGRHRAAPAKIKLRLGDRQIAIAIPAKPKKKHPPKHRERSRSR